ncbi:MAG: SBBP repeat-containing protein, partial [Acidimicrobiales bacterium]
MGQAGPGVAFVDQGGAYTSLLTDSGQAVVITRANPLGTKPTAGKASSASSHVVTMGLVGSNPHPAIERSGRLPGVTDYLVGSSPAGWHTGIPSYSSVRYQQVYPGVNLTYVPGQQGAINYELDLAPGESPNGIAFAIGGAKVLSIDPSGNLVMSLGDSQITQPKPSIYQQIGGRRVSVPGGFVLKGGGKIGFEVGSHDRSLGLVIDPTLAYSTSFGGTGTDFSQAIALDSSGDAFVTGSTDSIDFPVHTPSQLPFQTMCGTACTSGTDAFVSELNPAGSAILFSAYVGGTGTGAGSSSGTGIAVTSAGARDSIYLAGTTSSSNFPVTPNAYQASCAATPCAGSGFVVELSLEPNAGSFDSHVAYSTYLGGNGRDSVKAMALGSNGDVYLTGTTSSANFPVTSGAYDPCTAGGCGSFVTALNPAKASSSTPDASLVYSTYLGSGPAAQVSGIGVDSSGDAYVAGSTNQFSLTATPGSYDSGPCGTKCGFVVEVDPTGGESYATYLQGTSVSGGIGPRQTTATGIAVDPNGDAFVVGFTNNATYPTTPGAFQQTCHVELACQGGPSIVSGFVTKVAAGGKSFLYSTFLAGQNSPYERAQSVAIDSSGDAYVLTGRSSSNNFLTLNAFENTCSACLEGVPVLSELNPNGKGLMYSTYLSASGSDATGLAVNPSTGDAYVTASFGVGATALPPTRSLGTPGGVSVEEVAGPASTVPPIIDQLSPSSGPSVGGTTVTITGASLGGATAVLFGGVPAASYTQVSPTEVTAVSPPQTGAGVTVPVQVATGSGSTELDAAYPPELFSYGVGTWALTGPLSPPGGVYHSTASLLSGPACANASPSVCGDVLNAGGGDPAGQSAAALYDPSTNAWTATGSMNVARSFYPSSTTLSSGQVLVAGGTSPPSSEVYDPATGAFAKSSLVSMVPSGSSTADTPSYLFSATSLSGPACAQARPSTCGDVLVAGGSNVAVNSGEGSLANAELYDPSNNTWSAIPSMAAARETADAIVLSGPRCAQASPSTCGEVLVAGGNSPNGPLSSAELYNPATNAWTPTGSLFGPLPETTATMISGPECKITPVPSYCGKVLVNGAGATFSELYDPANGKFSLTGNLATPPSIVVNFATGLLPDGLVVFSDGNPDTELYNPVTASWTEAVATTYDRHGFASAQLSNGSLLAVGG